MRCLKAFAEVWDRLFQQKPHPRTLHDYAKIKSSRAWADLPMKYQGEDLKKRQDAMLQGKKFIRAKVVESYQPMREGGPYSATKLFWEIDE